MTDKKSHPPLTSLPSVAPMMGTSGAMSQLHFASHTLPSQFAMTPFFNNHGVMHPQVAPPVPTNMGLPFSDNKPKMTKQKTKNTVPATIPIVQVEEGVEYITFTYSVKGMSKEYKIRTDIDQLDIESMDATFKVNNCVYPRAYVSKEQYTGNRWDYETTVNNLGWRLAWLNQEELDGKRGLIQRAVDSYRNRFPEMRSRRVVRQEKLIKGTLRKRSERPSEIESPQPTKTYKTESKKLKSAKSLTFEMIMHGQVVKTRIRCDIESVDLQELTSEFKALNAVYPRALSHFNEQESLCNEIGWKLVMLNTKLNGKRGMLQRALDVYRLKFGDKPRKGKRAVEEVTHGLFNKEESELESESSDGLSAAELLHEMGHRP